MILVTGGTGFFGKTLVRALAQRGEAVRVLARANSDVSGLDVKNVSLVRGSVEDRASMEQALRGVDVLFHGAAVVKELVKDRSIFDTVNVAALDSVLELAGRAGVKRVVYTSSFFAIGPSDDAPNRVADETWRRQPRYCTDYERTKFLAEAVVAKHVANGLDVVSVLPGFIFGPGDMTEGNLITRTLLDLEQGRLPGLPGGGRKLWCLVSTEDVKQGHLLALEKGKRGGRYLIGGDNVAVIDLLREYHRLGGSRPPRLSLPFWVVDVGGALEELRWKLTGANVMLSKGKACAARHDWAYSSEHARSELGYTWTPWQEVLARTVAWMKEKGLLKPRGGAR